jgi:hypothetical protein
MLDQPSLILNQITFNLNSKRQGNMTTTQLDKIVKRQVKDDLLDRGLCRKSLKEHEYNLELYKMALKLMAEF